MTSCTIKTTSIVDPKKFNSNPGGPDVKRNFSQLRDPMKCEFQCPVCGSSIAYKDVRIDFGTGYKTVPFACHSCGTQLSVSRIYLWSVFLGLTMISLAIPLALRMRPWWAFLVVALVCSQVLGLLAGIYMKLLIPPNLQEYQPEGAPLQLFRRRGPR